MGEDDLGPFSDGAAALAGAMLQLDAMFEPIMIAAKGYVVKCKENGFSESAADQMGAAYHNATLRFIISKMVGNG